MFPAEAVPPDFTSLSSLRDSPDAGGLDYKVRAEIDRQSRNIVTAWSSATIEKLRQLVGFCFQEDADVVVLPRYSVPPMCLEALLDFSTRMTIIAGIGSVRSEDVTILEALGFLASEIPFGREAFVLLSPAGNSILTSGDDNSKQSLLSDQRARAKFPIEVRGDKYVLAVGDPDADRYSSVSCDLILLPTLSGVGEARPKIPMAVASHSRFGCSETSFVPPRRSKSAVSPGIPRGSEGVLIVDLTFADGPAGQRASQPSLSNTAVHAVSALIYRGRNPDLGDAIGTLAPIAPAQDTEWEREALLDRLRDAWDTSLDRPVILGAYIKEITLRLTTSRSTSDLWPLLFRQVVLSDKLLTVDEQAYLDLLGLTAVFRRLQSAHPGRLTRAWDSYATRAEELSGRVRSSLLSVRHRGRRSTEGSASGNSLEWIFYATLGSYDPTNAERSLPRQLVLLRTLARLRVPGLKIRYRLFTTLDNTNALQANFEAICILTHPDGFDSAGPSTGGEPHGETPDAVDDYANIRQSGSHVAHREGREVELANAEDLRESFGQLLHSTYTGAYSLSYSFEEPNRSLEDSGSERLDPPSWMVEIRPTPNMDGRTAVLNGHPDWAYVGDFLRSLNVPAVVELECSAAIDSQPTLLANESGHGRSFGVQQTDRSGFDVRSEVEESVALDELTTDANLEQASLSLRVFVGANAPLPDAVAEFIGAEVAGLTPFKVEAPELSTSGEPLVSPSQALRIFHPPYGTMYRTAGHGRSPLRIAIERTDFPQRGIDIGNATVRQVRADQMVDVRLSDRDRLRHTYVIGKTGSGKTNLLKRLAQQDVAVPSRGVTVIDPHGDLVDHVVGAVPSHRLGEVTLIDFGRSDYVPILNPLSFPSDDQLLRDRTIQELILLISQRIYHEYTGPRFDEMVRLAIDTMLDVGYALPPSLVDIPRLFTNEDFQERIVAGLADEELKARWEFHSRMKGERDYASTVDWAVSKFDDLARDETLKAALGGYPATLDVASTINQNGILLVRIPESVIGRQASNFIGSLILMQLRMAVLRRDRATLTHVGRPALPPHFVYIDEFQKFATTEIDSIVAEARKFGVGFTLAHQNLEQLREFSRHTGSHEQQLLNAIIGNVANIVVFSVGAFDAELLGRQLELPASALMSIGRYEAVARLTVDGVETNAFTLSPDLAHSRTNPRNVETIENRMRSSRVWRARSEVIQEMSTNAADLAGEATNLVPDILPRFAVQARAEHRPQEHRLAPRRVQREPKQRRIQTTSSKWNELVGPFYGTSRVARMLSIGHGDVDKLRTDRTLLGLLTSDGQYVFPSFQFGSDDRPIAGFNEILKAFDQSPDEDWSLATWLRASRQDLRGKSVMEVLMEAGVSESLVDIARATAWRWTH